MTIFLQLKEFVSKKLIYKIVERKFKKKIFFFPRQRWFLCSSGCLGACSVDRDGVKLVEIHLTLLGLKVCTTTSQTFYIFKITIF